MSDHIAEARKMVGRPQIRETFLRNGARIEPDRDDLPDWVYESAFELLELAAPAVQGEPVAWMVTAIRPDFDKPVKSLHSVQMLADEQQRHWEGRECLVYQTPLYTAPQPAEQQPELCKYQPCGCVICTCEHETQCQGCGANHCGTHPVGQFPEPAYQQPAPDVAGLVEALQKEATSLCDAVEKINDLPPVIYALQAGIAVNKVRDAVAALASHRSRGGDV